MRMDDQPSARKPGEGGARTGGSGQARNFSSAPQKPQGGAAGGGGAGGAFADALRRAAEQKDGRRR